MFGLSKKLDQLQQSLQQQTEKFEQKEREQLERETISTQEILAQLVKLTESAGKQEMAVGDLLDTMEEWQEDRKQQETGLKDKLLSKTEEELSRKTAQERALLEMVMSACDQLFNLRQAAQKAEDEAWQRQLELAENVLKDKARHAELQQTGCIGEPFSYEIHEAAERVETDEVGRDMTIADVITPGFWYRGKCLRKAKVAVYRTRQEEET